jgi:hypothetical protein
MIPGIAAATCLLKMSVLSRKMAVVLLETRHPLTANHVLFPATLHGQPETIY